MQLKDNNIIKRVINETATKEESSEVIDWFSTTVEGQQYLSDMLDKDAYMMENEPSVGKSFTPLQSERLYRKIEEAIRQNRIKRNLLRVAVVLLPLVLIAGFAVYLNRQAGLFTAMTYSEVYIPKGEDAHLYFQDGTEVFLNADTRIRYPDKFGLGKREVYLDGEAYFNVTTNKKRPFIVHAQNTKIEVRGTSFNANAYADSDNIQVVLDEGKILFEVDQKSYLVKPGQKIVYNKLTGKTTMQNLINSSNASLWKKNTLHFYDTPLSEVIKVLERKFDVQFHIQTPEVLKYSYTITTKQSSIENLLKELQKIAPVQFMVEGDSIMVNMIF